MAVFDWEKIEPYLLDLVKESPEAKFGEYGAKIRDHFAGQEMLLPTDEAIRKHLRSLHMGPKERRRLFAEGSTLDDLAAMDDEEEVAIQLVEEEIEREAQKAGEREKRALAKLLARRTQLIDSFRQELRDYPRLQIAPPRADDGRRKSRSLVLCITDAHVGQLFHRTRGGGLGEYNLEVFTDRVRRMASKVVAIANDLRAGGPIGRIVVFFGGDLLDGHTIHPGHDHEAVGITAQLRVGPEVFARLLMAELSANFAEVDVFGVPGNHGRLGRKAELDMVSDSLDLAFMDIMELHCQGMPNIVWHPRETWFSYWTLHGHTFFGSHGDSFKSWAGVPFYGATRFKGRLEAMIHRPIDTIITGHHHSPAAWMNGFSNIVMNGSMVGTSSFGSWLGMGGAPVQKLILVSDEYAAATIYDLILAERAECLTLQPVCLDRPVAPFEPVEVGVIEGDVIEEAA